MTNTTYNFVSDTAAKREAFRAEIVNADVERDIRPIDPQIIRDNLHPDYVEDFDNAMATGESRVLQVRMCSDLLRAMIAANGANRERTMSHCEGLASDFRGEVDEDGNLVEGTGYEPAMTHVVISNGFIMVDGGHSTYAMAMAFYPLSVFDGIYTRTKIVTNEEGEEEEVIESVLPNTSSKFELNIDMDDEGNRIEGTGEEKAEEYRNRIGEEKLYFNLVVNAPGYIVRKLAERRLNIGVKEYLLMVPQVRQFIEGLFSADEAEQVVKAWYRRTDCKIKTKEGEDVIVYGTVNGGGRPNNAEAPAWLLSFAPQLHDTIEIMREEQDYIGALHNSLEGLSRKDVITAMCCLDVDGMQRLWSAVTASKNKASSLAKELQPELQNLRNDPKWSKAPSWWLVNTLVAYGNGRSAKDACGNPRESAVQQDLKNRGPGWDRYEYDVPEDGEGEDRDLILGESAQTVANLIGATEEYAEAIARKTHRKSGGAKGGKTTRRRRKKTA